MTPASKTAKSFKDKLYIIIFESDTKAGRLFDVVLLVAIVLSVLVVMLESVKHLQIEYGELLVSLEWFFTILFSVEYAARLYASNKTTRYAMSFYGIIDLLSILPTYLSLIIVGSQSLLVIRILRLLRIFRILKLTQYLGEANVLKNSLIASKAKIIVFIGTVISLTIIFGTLMYLIEGGDNGFTSIPKSVYWAIVTLTTVGYGDIAPATTLGQTLATIIMILGYGIIAVPTGIVTAELTHQSKKAKAALSTICQKCGEDNHYLEARYCHRCGNKF